MTFAEHLGEVRQRFLVVALSLTVLGVLSFIFYPEILHFLQRPYCHASPKRCTFLVTSPLDGLSLRVKIAFYGGVFFSLPVVLWQSWRFITPGLMARERKYAIPFVASSVVFFVAGVTLAYVSFAHAIQFLQAIGGKSLISYYNPVQYLSLILLMMFVFGVTFEFPVVLVALELAGVVTPRQLLSAWRYAIIAITITSAVITPSGDPLSMMALAVPLTLFYFAAIAVGKICQR
ncbi:MAG TPA: twin-arginine translocase subunit TatC [Acidimicrobiales bacterium]